MAELPMRTIAIVLIFLVVAAIGVIFLFSTFTETGVGDVFFNISENMSTNASGEAGAASALKPLL